MKRIGILLLVLGVLYAVTGCNTLRGMGRDVQAVGSGVEDVAR